MANFQIVATLEQPEKLEQVPDASKLKKKFHIPDGWTGRLTLFDGDNFNIEIVGKNKLEAPKRLCGRDHKSALSALVIEPCHHRRKRGVQRSVMDSSLSSSSSSSPSSDRKVGQERTVSVLP